MTLGVWATFAVSETFAAKAEETALDIEGSNCPLAPRVSWRIAAAVVVIPLVFVTAEEVAVDGFDYNSPNPRDVAISDSVRGVAAPAESVLPGEFVAYAPAWPGEAAADYAPSDYIVASANQFDGAFGGTGDDGAFFGERNRRNFGLGPCSDRWALAGIREVRVFAEFDRALGGVVASSDAEWSEIVVFVLAGADNLPSVVVCTESFVGI